MQERIEQVEDKIDEKENPIERRHSISNISHPSAFGVVELYIYVFAIYETISTIVVNYLSSGTDAAQSFVYIVTATMFVLVILQNYFMMRIADDQFIGYQRGYKFIERNDSSFRTIERILRLLIVALILLSSKYPVEQYPQGLVYSLISYSSDTIGGIVYSVHKIAGNAMPNDWDLSSFSDRLRVETKYGRFLNYYAGVIFLIMLLNLAWDLVNLIAVQERKRNTGSEYSTYRNRSPYDSDLFSLLCYLRITKPVYRNDHDTVEFSDYVTKTGRDPGRYVEEMVLEGKLWRIYFLNSPVFRGRIYGIAFAALIAFSALYGANSTILLFLLGVCLALFLFYLTKVDRIRAQIKAPYTTVRDYFLSFEARPPGTGVSKTRRRRRRR